MSIDAYRGLIINPIPAGDFEYIPDGIVVLQDRKICFANSVAQLLKQSEENLLSLGIIIDNNQQLLFKGKLLQDNQMVILPSAVNTHDHTFQPPGISGELLYKANSEFYGWLPDTLIEGEQLAKDNPEMARRMAHSRLSEFAENGIGRVLQYTTSSLESAEIVLEEAEKIGIQVMVGFVAMDQAIDFINSSLSLEEEKEVILKETEELLKKHGKDKVCVIDRFPIAVSSDTRKDLAKLARKYGALYETHMDESYNEKKAHADIYDAERGCGNSILQILLEDGVFEPGSRVGLAHAIHTTQDEMELLRDKIKNGSEVFIRACPNSNGHLRSHHVPVFEKNEKGRDSDTAGVDQFGNPKMEYVYFPLEAWESIGATITLGTDQGAGRNNNIFQEAYDERVRQPKELTSKKLLQMATVNGLKSFGVPLSEVQIKEGNLADFMVVEMKGAESFYQDHINQTIDRQLARTIEGGMNPDNIHHVYVAGKKIK